jgi:hypothetical protein
MTTTYAWAGRILEIKIDGRVTAEAIEGFRHALADALGEGGPFAVCFDRSSMTAVTKDGRAALERWAAEYLPQLAGRCHGWADVYDQRRAASLTNAAVRNGHRSAAEPAYPQQVFADADVARDWLRSLLDGDPGQP